MFGESAERLRLDLRDTERADESLRRVLLRAIVDGGVGAFEIRTAPHRPDVLEPFE